MLHLHLDSTLPLTLLHSTPTLTLCILHFTLAPKHFSCKSYILHLLSHPHLHVRLHLHLPLALSTHTSTYAYILYLCSPSDTCTYTCAYTCTYTFHFTRSPALFPTLTLHSTLCTLRVKFYTGTLQSHSHLHIRLHSAPTLHNLLYTLQQQLHGHLR